MSDVTLPHRSDERSGLVIGLALMGRLDFMPTQFYWGRRKKKIIMNETVIDVPSLLYKNFDCQLICPLVKHTLDIRPR